MQPVEFVTYVRYKTKTNSTTFTNDNIKALMKIRQDEIAAAILRADEDILLLPQVASLVADQREYPQPTDILSRLKRVEVKLDGTTWVPLTEIDITRINQPISTETDITNVFNNSQLSEGNPGGARFDILRKSIVIYSGTIIEVEDGLKLWCDTYPAAITDLTSETDMSEDPSDTTHGIPRPLHEIWARGVIIDYKESKEKPIPLSERESNYDDDLDDAIATLKHGNLDREVVGSIPYDDGSEY